MGVLMGNVFALNDLSQPQQLISWSVPCAQRQTLWTSVGDCGAVVHACLGKIMEVQVGINTSLV